MSEDLKLLKDEYMRVYKNYDLVLRCLEDLIEIAKMQNNIAVGQRIAETMVQLNKG